MTFSFVVLALALPALAASPTAPSSRKQLGEMVEKLKKTPDDAALRVKAIALAQSLKPAPAIPEEAQRRLARGQAAFELAKGPSDYANSIREFQTALAAAPWFAAPYFNIGVAEEKSGHPKEAMDNFRWYLLAEPGAKDAPEVKSRIYKLEYAAEQQGRDADGKARGEQFEGAWRGTRGYREYQLLVRRKPDGGGLSLTMQRDGESEYPWDGVRDINIVEGELRLTVEMRTVPSNSLFAIYDIKGTVSADGKTLILTRKYRLDVGSRSDRTEFETETWTK